MRRPLRLLPGALLIPLALAAPALGATHTLTAGSAVARPCHRDISSSQAGRELIRAKAPARGLVSVRLKSAGDWDVAVFGRRGRLVAGSASFRGNELASGFVRRGERLTVQGCRFRGDARRARLSVHFTRIAKRRQTGRFKVVDVMTPKRTDKARLQALGLDLTEHGDRNSLEVILHGRADERELQRAGFRYTVRIADLAARTHRNHRRDVWHARATAASGLPSGRDGYRRLPDYDLDLKRLAMQYSSLVKPITLNHPSLLGRDVNGIEISANAQNTADGKPIFLIMGAHHAREWPSSEHTIEFAYDLLRNYGRDARATQLVDATRTIVVPIVNPDGFNISREAAPLGDFSLFDYEMKRKNCRVSDSTPRRYARGTCDDSQGGRLRGTDPNRNYGGLWGGSGASVTWFDDTFRGDAPFSEPETQNIRELVSSRQVTNLITNHTYSNLVLRPPGVADFGFPLEEPTYRALGASLAEHNGYSNDPSFGLYDTTGATEDWTFWSTGGLGFTFEIGPDEFHPPYATGVEAEYLGLAPAAGAGKGGNREAYYTMLQATADTSLHSVIEGAAPAGSTLKLSKTFQTFTSPVWEDDFGASIGDPMRFTDTLTSELRTTGPTFAWHVNPSTRPLVAGRHGRDAVADPQEPITLANPAGVPGENTVYPPEQPYEEIPFTVKGPADGVDNGRMTVHVEWGSPDTDWDIYVIGPNGQIVAQSASFGDTTEDASLFDPPPGEYRLHVVNYDQVMRTPDDWFNGNVTFRSPTPRVETGTKEAWTLTCVDSQGRVQATSQVIVDRGERAQVGNACSGTK
ncbi:MAG TPA: M14 family zinc carboxypeptidase [Thermoleophilaceae bacterium]|nr:M14 family zinc carboxypeptidase [Thermoleophilaceae bacterium]